MRLIRCALLFLATVSLPVVSSAQTADALASAVKNSANPELIGGMTKELGVTVPQASGAAGALLGLAKTRLKPEEFTKVAGAIPGIDALLAAAPAVAGTAGSGAASTLAKAAGGAGAIGGLASVAPAFDKLGLKPEMAARAVPLLTSYVAKTGGKDVASLLTGALK